MSEEESSVLQDLLNILQTLSVFNASHLLPILQCSRGGLKGTNQSLPEMFESCFC